MNNSELEGAKFLHKENDSIHTSTPVEFTLSQLNTNLKPYHKINAWMDVLSKIYSKKDPIVLDRIKKSYHKDYIIQPQNVPESFFENQKKIIRDRGEGNIEISQVQKNLLIDTLRKDQIASLDTWINYLSSVDSDYIPTWTKYWIFTGMTKLGIYDKEKKSFNSRTKNSVAPFPDLNREALAYAVNAIQRKVKKENIQDGDTELDTLLKSSTFGRYYAYAIEKVTPANNDELINTEGQWVKWVRNSDHMPLVKSLQGHGTGWCTAGEKTAQIQLTGGDFYIYYSNDNNGNPTIPRIAIRMQDNDIAEIRGISKDQNIDPYIGDVLEKKLVEFGEKGDLYKKRVSDMKKLTEITKNKDNLSKEDLRFIYEIDDQILGFGYEKDPRIYQLLQDRDIKNDLSLIFECDKSKISITPEEALSGDIIYHYGNLDLHRLQSADGLVLPESIGGSLNLSELQSAEKLVLPKSIGDYIDLSGLQSAKELVFPKSIGSLYLSRLQSVEGLVLPESIGGELNLSGLKSAEGLILPKSIGGELNLSGLQSAEGLVLPESIGRILDLSGLQSAEGLVFPKSIGGYLNLSRLQSAKGLVLPESIGSLYLSRLQSTEGLVLPNSIGGDLDLSGLQSAEGLVLPDSIGGDLYLSRLQSAEGLVFPKSIGGYLNLSWLQSTEGLVLPENIEGSLNLRGLQSAEGLVLPESIGGDLYLSGLQSTKGLVFPENIRGKIVLPKED